MFAILKQYWWVPLFYVIITLVLVVQGKFHFEFKQGSVFLVVLLLLPLLIPRLTKLEYGGLKIEMQKLRNEVVDTKHEVRKEVAEVRDQYRNLSDRLARFAEKSADYLKPQQSLSISDEKADELRKSINLSDEEIDIGLQSLDANLRVPAYIELQVRPRPRFLSELLDCFWLEQFYARRYNQTRPTWQLLVATERNLNVPEEIAQTERSRGKLLLKQALEFFRSEPKIDPGHQCKNRIEQMLSKLD
jgi:hypothetical protein